MSKEMIETSEERVQPVRITDNETGKTYELDFSRESVKFAEARKFELDDVLRFPATKVPELFFYAFRKNHKKIARDKTDKLLEDMDGLPTKMLGRLTQLYSQAALTHVLVLDEDAEKNTKVTVEL